MGGGRRPRRSRAGCRRRFSARPAGLGKISKKETLGTSRWSTVKPLSSQWQGTQVRSRVRESRFLHSVALPTIPGNVKQKPRVSLYRGRLLSYQLSLSLKVPGHQLLAPPQPRAQIQYRPAPSPSPPSLPPPPPPSPRPCPPASDSLRALAREGRLPGPSLQEAPSLLSCRRPACSSSAQYSDKWSA